MKQKPWHRVKGWLINIGVDNMLKCKECNAILEEHTDTNNRYLYLCPVCGCNYDENGTLINRRNKMIEDHNTLKKSLLDLEFGKNEINEKTTDKDKQFHA